MRLRECIKIDDKEYTVMELTVEEIINLLTGSLSGSNSHSQSEEEKTEEIKLTSVIENIFGDAGKLKEFMRLAMPGTNIGDLIKLAPSELKQIWDMVRKVNASFFDLAQKMEIPDTLLGMVKELLTDFSQHAVILSKQVMEQEFLDTDTPFSKEPLMPTGKVKPERENHLPTS